MANKIKFFIAITCCCASIHAKEFPYTLRKNAVNEISASEKNNSIAQRGLLIKINNCDYKFINVNVFLNGCHLTKYSHNSGRVGRT